MRPSKPDSSHVDSILNDAADRAGWDEASKLLVLERYIARHGDLDELQEFVDELVEEEEHEARG